jgi:SAM-dependent methyltransferase
MLERARQRAAEADLTNVDFEQADAQVHPFAPDAHDLVLSRFGVMFFADPVAAFTNLLRTTKPGGRLVAVVWQPVARNQWVTLPSTALAIGRSLPPIPDDVPGAFGLADPDRVRTILTAAGFTDVSLEDLAAPFWLGPDVEAAVGLAREIGVLRGAFEGLDADDTARALDALRDALASHHSANGVTLDSRAWVIRAVR